MARDDLNWVSLIDFTPGIYSKYGAVVTLGKDGAARTDDGFSRHTFGCYGDPDGGLRPLPRRIRTYTHDLSDVTEVAGFNRGPDMSTLNSVVPAAPNAATFTTHPTTRAIGTGRRAKVGVIDMIVEPGYPRDALTVTGQPLFPTIAERPWRDYTDRDGATRADSVHMVTCFRQNPVPLATDAASMFPRYGRLRSQWRRFDLAKYDAPIGTDLYDYESLLLSKADMTEEGSLHVGVNQANVPEYLNVTTGAVWRLANQPVQFQWMDPNNSTATRPNDGWGSGGLVSYKAVGTVVDAEDGVSREEVSSVGQPVVVAYFQHWMPVMSGVGFVEEFTANFLDFMGGPANTNTYGSTILQASHYPNGPYHGASRYTTENVPFFALEHLDHLVGFITHPSLMGNFLDRTYCLDYPSWAMRWTFANTILASWDNPAVSSPLNTSGVTDFHYEMWGFLKRAGAATGQTVASLFYGTTTNLPPSGGGSSPGQLTANPIEYPDIPGNHLAYGLDPIAFTWQNALVIVPHTGPGSVVTGAIEEGNANYDGTIIPTGGVTSKPVATPAGVVYGTKTCVALWNGQQAQNVSRQLDGFFWNAGTASECQEPDGYRVTGHSPFGRFGYLDGFVYAPNNWVMNLTTGGWYRLVDPVDTNPYPHMFYDTNISGDLYASRGCWDATHTGVLDLFVTTSRATEFQWVSQPIMSTINREQTITRIHAVVQGRGEVDVTIIGIDGTEITETFTVDSDRVPVQIVRPTNMTASDLTVVISSTGVDSSTDAPTVHAIHLGAILGPEHHLTDLVGP